MKYLLIKHYRGGPEPVEGWTTMDRWTAEEVAAHVAHMNDLAGRLAVTGEFVGSTALSDDGVFVRSDGPGALAQTPIPDAHDLVAGWMMIDVASHERALEIAGELSAAPGANGEPIREWLELRSLHPGQH
ncbi:MULTISPECIES: YciI family protein [Actinosynnema]|uniref:YciI family protein n=1 Tax=Actinosynnema TaxID=40566 RepID=UPI0020A59248|nr:YciI family protein [Actinosynnema pretiosum]MCP2096417.1 hypothetical protein [Actinosynnema pretiosum]